MDINVTIGELKRQLNIEQDFLDDDVLLQHFLNVAEESVNSYCGLTGLTIYSGSTLPISIHQATLFLAAHFYINRAMVSFAQGNEIPFTLRWLLDPYRDFIVG